MSAFPQLNPKDASYPYNRIVHAVKHGKSIATDYEKQRVMRVAFAILTTGVGIIATLYVSRLKSRSYTLLTGAMSCVAVLYLLYKSREILSSEWSRHIELLKGFSDTYVKLQEKSPNEEVEPITAAIAYYQEQSEIAHTEYVALRTSDKPYLNALERHLHHKATAAGFLAVSQYKLFKTIKLSSWITCHPKRIGLPLSDDPYLQFGKTSISCAETDSLTVAEIAEVMVAAMKKDDDED